MLVRAGHGGILQSAWSSGLVRPAPAAGVRANAESVTLSPYYPDEISAIAGLAADAAVQQAKCGMIGSVGEAQDFISTAISSWLDKYGPEMSQKLVTLAEPAAKKATEVIRPQIEDALKAYVPTFAAVAGGMLGLAVILGVWIGKPRRATA